MTFTIFCNHRFIDESANALLAELIKPHRLVYAQSVTTSNLASSAPDPAINDADIAYGQPDPQSLLTAPKLKWAQLTTAGYERYDRPDLRDVFSKRGAILTNSSAVFEEPCAQHALSMLLAAARQLPASFDNQRGAKAWPAAKIRITSRLLVGQTIVLLSFGSIGRRIAELLAPFRMNVIAVRRHPTGDEPVRCVAESQLEAVLPLADHVMNILPGGAVTKNLMNARRFAAMKAGAIFYNIGRGTTVDQTALLDALRSKHLDSAWLDVTDPEPLPPDHPLWHEPRCFITPHTAGGHADEFHRLVRHFVENLKRLERGEALVGRVI
jgi:phosphoglycerate dehydrogenase-like enzyme